MCSTPTPAVQPTLVLLSENEERTISLTSWGRLWVKLFLTLPTATPPVKYTRVASTARPARPRTVASHLTSFEVSGLVSKSLLEKRLTILAPTRLQSPSRP